MSISRIPLIRVVERIETKPTLWYLRFPNPNENPGIAHPLHMGYVTVTYATNVTVRTVTNCNSTGAGSFRQQILDHNGGSGFSVVIFDVSGVCDAAGVPLSLTRGDIAILGSTAPGKGGYIWVGDYFSIGNNVTNFYIEHLTFNAGRLSEHGGTNGDSRDSFQVAGGVKGVYRNLSVMGGTDGSWDYNLTGGNPKKFDQIACNIGIGLINAGHSEGAHDRTQNLGIGYNEDNAMIMCCHHTGSTRNPQINYGGSGETNYQHIYVGNHICYNVTQQHHIETYWATMSVPGHFSVVGTPVPIHGPADPVDDNDNRFDPEWGPLCTTNTYYYCDDTYWLEERQCNRSNCGYITPNGGGGFNGICIDTTQRIRVAGARISGTGSPGYGPSGTAILDSGAVPGAGTPPRYSPMVLGDFENGDHHQVAGGRTVVELWQHANCGAHPRSRGPMLERWWSLLYYRGNNGQGYQEGRPSYWSELQLSSDYDPGQTNDWNEARSDIYGTNRGLVVARHRHALDPEYPGSPTTKNPATGWPYIVEYALKRSLLVEAPSAWEEIIDTAVMK